MNFVLVKPIIFCFNRFDYKVIILTNEITSFEHFDYCDFMIANFVFVMLMK